MSEANEITIIVTITVEADIDTDVDALADGVVDAVSESDDARLASIFVVHDAHARVEQDEPGG